MKCDLCGCEKFFLVAEDAQRYPMIIEVFGDRVLICHECGAVRYPEEVGGSALKVN